MSYPAWETVKKTQPIQNTGKAEIKMKNSDLRDPKNYLRPFHTKSLNFEQELDYIR